MSALRKLKIAAGATAVIFAAHAYESGVAVKPAHHGATSAAVPAAISGPITRNANEALANQMAASRYGWRGGQLTCLDELWTEESGFDSTAVNASSGATGIPQLLPSAHKIPANWSDPATQISWGIDYIKGTYGSPCRAWQHERSVYPNWY